MGYLVEMDRSNEAGKPWTTPELRCSDTANTQEGVGIPSDLSSNPFSLPTISIGV